MTSPHHDTDFLHDLRVRSAAEGGTFWVDGRFLAIFEPATARQVNGANWHGLDMPDRLVDQVRRRRSPQVPWVRVRTAWLTQLHRLTTGAANTSLVERMAAVLDARLGRDVDLVMLAQDIAVQPLLPIALSGLTPAETTLINRDLHQKLIRLIDPEQQRGLRRKLRFASIQIRAGLVIRRVLRDRAAGRRPREADLADPIVDMLPDLGMDRALDAVATVLTAMGGPPGSAAASVLYELARNPDWSQRLTTELQRLDLAEFCADPRSAAPVTHRFVKEVLRMWSPPLLLLRPALRSFDLDGTRLEKGQGYLVSPHLIHRNPRYWQQADTFDPDRFLPGAPHGPAGRGHYVPFGWAPKQCIGAGVGTIQLMALCYLMCTQYRFTVRDIDAVTMAYRFAPIPQNFRGDLEIRPVRQGQPALRTPAPVPRTSCPNMRGGQRDGGR